MIINNKSGISIENENYKDVFGAYLLNGAQFDLTDGLDIPYLEYNGNIELPISVVAYNKLGDNIKKANTFVHFYLEDYVFDGKYGLWNALIQNRSFTRGFSFSKLDEVDGVILPDYSLYNDMPLPIQMWNTFRSRTVGYILQKMGYSVIPNIRWADERSYKFCYLGIRKGSIVSIGSLGCLRARQDHKLFINGLIELILRIEPKVIIIYGDLSNDMIEIFERFNQDYLYFESQISGAMEKTYGNESK